YGRLSAGDEARHGVSRPPAPSWTRRRRVTGLHQTEAFRQALAERPHSLSLGWRQHLDQANRWIGDDARSGDPLVKLAAEVLVDVHGGIAGARGDLHDRGGGVGAEWRRVEHRSRPA